MSKIESLAKKYPLLRRVLDEARACPPEREECRCRWYASTSPPFMIISVRVPCWWGDLEARVYAMAVVTASVGDLSQLEEYLAELRVSGGDVNEGG